MWTSGSPIVLEIWSQEAEHLHEGWISQASRAQWTCQGQPHQTTSVVRACCQIGQLVQWDATEVLLILDCGTLRPGLTRRAQLHRCLQAASYHPPSLSDRDICGFDPKASVNTPHDHWIYVEHQHFESEHCFRCVEVVEYLFLFSRRNGMHRLKIKLFLKVKDSEFRESDNFFVKLASSLRSFETRESTFSL